MAFHRLVVLEKIETEMNYYLLVGPSCARDGNRVVVPSDIYCAVRPGSEVWVSLTPVVTLTEPK